ncbi:transposase [Cupriavidus necator]|uniref:transposase n=1 Tax=Cupriavidus necator TaxID=106590 RepID=UPI001E2AEEEA|nr:transposase [Cupriavidus necator]
MGLPDWYSSYSGRHFDNRREVGSCVGLVPQPYDSGESRVDQGISKQGNRRGRSLLIEMAWFWHHTRT